MRIHRFTKNSAEKMKRHASEWWISAIEIYLINLNQIRVENCSNPIL